jgi:hypothetical protein
LRLLSFGNVVEVREKMRTIVILSPVANDNKKWQQLLKIAEGDANGEQLSVSQFIVKDFQLSFLVKAMQQVTAEVNNTLRRKDYSKGQSHTTVARSSGYAVCASAFYKAFGAISPKKLS